MSPKQGLAWVKRHGVVLQAARGPVPNLAEAIAGGPIRGSWWGHPKGNEIFRVATEVSESDDVLVCKLVGGKVTYVHRRLWPALVKLAGRFKKAQLAKVWNEHTSTGAHRARSTAFPKWVPPEIMRDAERLSVAEAEKILSRWLGLVCVALFLFLTAVACVRPARAAGLCSATDTRIVVDTAKHTLALCVKVQETATYGIRLGKGGVGKKAEGDGKTPLGTYALGEPRKSEKFGLFIPIGYPTPEQRRQGYTGGDIGVHGPHRAVRWLGSLVNTFDSSDGCIGLAKDDEIKAVADWVTKSHARTIEIR